MLNNNIEMCGTSNRYFWSPLTQQSNDYVVAILCAAFLSVKSLTAVNHRNFSSETVMRLLSQLDY